MEDAYELGILVHEKYENCDWEPNNFLGKNLQTPTPMLSLVLKFVVGFDKI